MSQQESSYLLPDFLHETSRYSTPRSSIGGASTDCEADVESNLSLNSEDVTPSRRRSSNGIYGIARASKVFLLSQKGNPRREDDEESDTSFGWRIMSATQKFVFISSIIIFTIIILGLLFIYPRCRIACGNEAGRASEQMKGGSNWPIEFRNVKLNTKIVLADVNGDDKKELVVSLAKMHSQDIDGAYVTISNSSMVVAFDADTGRVVKKINVNFKPFWISCDGNDRVNASCYTASRNGTVAKLNMASEQEAWSSRPCLHIHSISDVSDIDSDGIPDLIVVCSWKSAEQATISGIALISGRQGSLIGSKIRYQLSQLPSSFLMKHKQAKNNTCILFGTTRSKRSAIWALRLNRLVEIATGARKKVNLVSENPLLVVKNVRMDIRPVHHDVTGDGFKDVGFVLQEGLIAFMDGVSLKLRETIDARRGNIMSISILPMQSFKRPLLAVLKRGETTCQNSYINIYDFRSTLDPYVIEIPDILRLIEEDDRPNMKLFTMWLTKQPKECSKKSKVQIKLPEMPIKNMPSLSFLKSKKASSLVLDDLASDGTNDIDIDAIDKDVLENLREYVGINDKGVTRHHKLFHLVCNYLLLRFLISYGITTESVLKDFKSTRNHLLSLSNRNLGHVLTNQLKGLLATDYNYEKDPATLLDDLDNDIDWLRDAQVKQPISRRRRDMGVDEWYALDDNESEVHKPWNKRKGMRDSIKQALYDTGDTSLQQETGDANNSPTTTSHITSSRQSWHMNETEASSEERPLNDSSGNFLEGSKSKSLKVGKNCPLTVPIFKMLEISKTNYSWKNITQESEQNIQKSGMAEKKCQEFQVEVKDTILHKNRLYYISEYSKTSNSGNILQLTWVKLNY